MVVFICKDFGKSIYLCDFYCFGCLVYFVDILLNYLEIIWIYVVIEWVELYWYICDLSKNGVWFNGRKFEKYSKF